MNSETLTEQDFLVIHKSTVLPAGTVAPDFTLKSTPDETVTLSDFRGHPVILFFYPSDWSPVCGDQAALYNELLPEFQDWMPDSSASLWTASGATWPSAEIASCIFRSSLTSR